VIQTLDYGRIRATRRENFLRLRELLPGVSLLREDLPEGTCPLFFPILVEDKKAAAQALRERGVSAVEFWNDEHPQAAPHSGSDARFLRSHVLELPIHQDVTALQVSYIADQVKRLRLASPKQRLRLESPKQGLRLASPARGPRLAEPEPVPSQPAPTQRVPSQC